MAINFDKIKEISLALERGNRHTLRCFHVSTFVKKGKIVAIGWNSVKSNPKNLKYNYLNREGKNIGHSVMTHSEISLITRYGEDDCSDCYLVNTRLNMHNQFSTAAPCQGCAHALSMVSVRGIFATDAKGKFEKIA